MQFLNLLLLLAPLLNCEVLSSVETVATDVLIQTGFKKSITAINENVHLKTTGRIIAKMRKPKPLIVNTPFSNSVTQDVHTPADVVMKDIHTPSDAEARVAPVSAEEPSVIYNLRSRKVLSVPATDEESEPMFKKVPVSKKRARQNSISTDFDPEFQKQGEIGSCHVFATTELVRAATGFKVSKARLFLDHLMSVESNGPDAQRGIFDRNVDFVNENREQRAVPASCKSMPGWEWGRLFDNLQLLQTVGGIVVPMNSDWADIEKVMARIGEERALQVKDLAIVGDNQRARLGEAGLNEIIQRALAAEHGSQIGNRELIKEATKDLIITAVPLDSSTNLFIKTTILAKALEQGPVYLSVDADLYYKAAKGTALNAKVGVTEHSNHAVCLVGYRVTDDKFLIKDSNIGRIVEVKAQDLILSTNTGYQLHKR